METGEIKQFFKGLTNKAIRAKNRITINISINKAIADGELTYEEKIQILEAVKLAGLDEATTMEEAQQRLKKVQYRLGHLAAINERIDLLDLVDGQVQANDFAELTALAAEIDKKEDFIEEKLFYIHGKRCLMALRRPVLEEKIRKAGADGKINEIENVLIKQYAARYGFTESELYTMMGELLK